MNVIANSVAAAALVTAAIATIVYATGDWTLPPRLEEVSFWPSGVIATFALAFSGAIWADIIRALRQ